MKFSNGCWLNAESVNVFGTTQVYERRVDEDRGLCFDLRRLGPVLRDGGDDVVHFVGVQRSVRLKRRCRKKHRQKDCCEKHRKTSHVSMVLSL